MDTVVLVVLSLFRCREVFGEIAVLLFFVCAPISMSVGGCPQKSIEVSAGSYSNGH